MALLLTASRAQAQSRVSFTQPFGPHAVGFTDTRLTDRAREVVVLDSAGERVPGPPRPLQVSVWYPARIAPADKPMRYREYAWLLSARLTYADTTVAGRLAAERAMLERSPQSSLVAAGSREARAAVVQAAMSREFDIVTRAHRGAERAPGTYPLVIYAPGSDGASFENDILAEYLASFGYIVLSSPSRGAGGPMSIDLPGLEAQARDIEYLIGYGRELPGASKAGVAVVGHSWGGLAHVLVASRNGSVRAIVSLDGSVRYFYGSRDFVARALKGNEPYTTPSLFLNQGANTDSTFFRRSRADTAFLFFDSIRYADAYRITMHSIDHQNFVAWFNRFSRPQPLNFVSDTAISNRAYEEVARLTLAFLDAYLKGDSEAWLSLTKPSPALAGRTRFTVHAKAAQRPLPTVASFAAAARAYGIQRAPELLELVRAANPSYSLPYGQLVDWGWSLEGLNAIAVFRVAVDLYPNEPSAHSDLGDAYLAQADTAHAVSSFEHVLQLDPSRTYARSVLERIRRR